LTDDPRAGTAGPDASVGADAAAGAGALVIVATYDEADNIGPLLDAIHQALPAADVLVIDDNSPDGTGRLVDRRIAAWPPGERPWLTAIHRAGKQGLGTAAVLGFQTAIAEGYRQAITLDADFSHPPDRLPALWRAVRDGVDVCVGSRYVAGGSIVGWPLRRRIASALINGFARRMLGLPVRDVSGAFRAYRTATLAAMGPESVVSRGYGYLEEVLLRLRQAGATFREVPIRFVDRERGQSKITLREAFAAVAMIVRLAARRGRGGRD